MITINCDICESGMSHEEKEYDGVTKPFGTKKPFEEMYITYCIKWRTRESIHFCGMCRTNFEEAMISWVENKLKGGD